MLDSFSDFLKKKECEYREYENIANLSRIKIGTVARYLIYPDSTEKIIDILKAIRDLSYSYVLLGKMSNVLFKESVYNGIVIKTDKICRKRMAESFFELECGCSLPKITRELAERDLGGFEGLMGIPGSIGGMIKQNAGAFGYQISDRCTDCVVYDILSDCCFKVKRTDMNFVYRGSILNDKRYLLLSARFEAIHKPRRVFYKEVAHYSDIRRKTQPVGEPSLGSVFKRADGISAGYYIDSLNLKGASVGGAKISDKHAGFIVNTGEASASDVLKLIDNVKSAVMREYNIALEEEIEII